MSQELSVMLRETSAKHPATAAQAQVSRTRQPKTPSARSERATAAGPVHTSKSRRRWLEVLPAVVGLVLFLAALEVLRIELRTVSWAKLMADVGRVPRADLGLAIALTVLNYLALTGSGEEAKVDLEAFTLEGSHGAKFRQAVHRLERERATFRMIDPPGVPDVMQELREVSNEWLAQKSAAEKGFSLGYFDEAYLRRFPIAVIEQGNRIQAFANVWRGAGRIEVSIDLMRHRRNAPNGVMEALFVHLMLWGKQQGYRWFALGTAPLSGFEQSAVASVWNRIGAFVYEHSDSLYNVHGVRAYKEKFNPVWEPRYLACPGGLRLPRILADVSALVAGGYRRIVLK